MTAQGNFCRKKRDVHGPGASPWRWMGSHHKVRACTKRVRVADEVAKDERLARSQLPEGEASGLRWRQL